MDSRHANPRFESNDEMFLAFSGPEQEAESKEGGKSAALHLLQVPFLIIVDHYMKIHNVLKKQVTVKFYQAINFTCSAEEPICRHSGDQKTGTEACARFLLLSSRFCVINCLLGSC